MNLAYIALGRAVGSKAYKSNEIYGRLACFLTLAILAGWSMTSVAQDLALATLPHAGRLYLSVIFIFQLIGCASILTSSCYSNVGAVTRLAITLPVGRWYVGFIGLLPALVLSCVFLLMALPPLAALFHSLGLNWLAIALSGIVGIASSFGALGAVQSRVGRLLFPVTLLSSEYCILYFLQHNLTSPSNFGIATCTFTLLLLYILTIALVPRVFRSYYRLSTRNPSTHDVHACLPTRWWMGTCSYRNKVISASLGVTFAMSILTTGVILHYHLPTSLGATLGALLLAVGTSDFRGIFRLTNPTEIAAVDATHAFIRRTFFASFLLTVLSISPLLLLVIWPGSPYPIDRLISVLLLASSIGAGLGHILATRHRTIALPLLTIVTSFVILCFLPGTDTFSGLEWWWQDSFYLLTALVFRVAAERVEYKRNPFIWRSKNQ